ncbi:MAG: hypothetical protein AABX16_02345 [Nanoarchaeota archaeon]
MKNLELWHGAHNTFLVTHSLQNLRKINIIELCNTHQTEGLILLKMHKKNIYMKFYDRDGITNNCGNGLRVAAQYSYEKGLALSRGKIFVGIRRFDYSIKNNNVTIKFSNPIKRNGMWNVGGVLHKVIIVNSFENIKIKARLLRNKYQCNITFIRKINRNFFAQTYETGVEDFTASCGTGAIAAALETKNSLIFMPGGLLRVVCRRNDIFLRGPAKKLKEIAYE